MRRSTMFRVAALFLVSSAVESAATHLSEPESVAMTLASLDGEPYKGQTGRKCVINPLSDNCWGNVSFSKSDYEGMKALIVTTSYGKPIKGFMGITMKTGLTLVEATAPYYVYQDAGFQVDVASIKGGSVPYDTLPMTPSVFRFMLDKETKNKFNSSLRIDDVDFSQYDIIFMAGGWGAAFDLGYSVTLGRKVSEALYAGYPLVGSTCHGALGFVQANMTDGTPWVKGRKLTGVTNGQIKELGISTQTPMHPQEELEALGADFQCIHGHLPLYDVGAESVSFDDQGPIIITGQNQNAACIAAQRQLLFVLGAKNRTKTRRADQVSLSSHLV